MRVSNFGSGAVPTFLAIPGVSLLLCILGLWGLSFVCLLISSAMLNDGDNIFLQNAIRSRLESSFLTGHLALDSLLVVAGFCTVLILSLGNHAKTYIRSLLTGKLDPTDKLDGIVISGGLKAYTFFTWVSTLKYLFWNYYVYYAIAVIVDSLFLTYMKESFDKSSEKLPRFSVTAELQALSEHKFLYDVTDYYVPVGIGSLPRPTLWSTFQSLLLLNTSTPIERHFSPVLFCFGMLLQAVLFLHLIILCLRGIPSFLVFIARLAFGLNMILTVPEPSSTISFGVEGSSSQPTVRIGKLKQWMKICRARLWSFYVRLFELSLETDTLFTFSLLVLFVLGILSRQEIFPPLILRDSSDLIHQEAFCPDSYSIRKPELPAFLSFPLNRLPALVSGSLAALIFLRAPLLPFRPRLPPLGRFSLLCSTLISLALAILDPSELCDLLSVDMQSRSFDTSIVRILTGLHVPLLSVSLSVTLFLMLRGPGVRTLAFPFLIKKSHSLAHVVAFVFKQLPTALLFSLLFSSLTIRLGLHIFRIGAGEVGTALPKAQWGVALRGQWNPQNSAGLGRLIGLLYLLLFLAFFGGTIIFCVFKFVLPVIFGATDGGSRFLQQISQELGQKISTPPRIRRIFLFLPSVMERFKSLQSHFLANIRVSVSHIRLGEYRSGSTLPFYVIFFSSISLFLLSLRLLHSLLDLIRLTLQAVMHGSRVSLRDSWTCSAATEWERNWSYWTTEIPNAKAFRFSANKVVPLGLLESAILHSDSSKVDSSHRAEQELSERAWRVFCEDIWILGDLSLFLTEKEDPNQDLSDNAPQHGSDINISSGTSDDPQSTLGSVSDVVGIRQVPFLSTNNIFSFLNTPDDLDKFINPVSTLHAVSVPDSAARNNSRIAPMPITPLPIENLESNDSLHDKWAPVVTLLEALFEFYRTRLAESELKESRTLLERQNIHPIQRKRRKNNSSLDIRNGSREKDNTTDNDTGGDSDSDNDSSDEEVEFERNVGVSQSRLQFIALLISVRVRQEYFSAIERDVEKYGTASQGGFSALFSGNSVYLPLFEGVPVGRSGVRGIAVNDTLISPSGHAAQPEIARWDVLPPSIPASGLPPLYVRLPLQILRYLPLLATALLLPILVVLLLFAFVIRRLKRLRIVFERLRDRNEMDTLSSRHFSAQEQRRKERNESMRQKMMEEEEAHVLLSESIEMGSDGESFGKSLVNLYSLAHARSYLFGAIKSLMLRLLPFIRSIARCWKVCRQEYTRRQNRSRVADIATLARQQMHISKYTDEHSGIRPVLQRLHEVSGSVPKLASIPAPVQLLEAGSSDLDPLQTAALELSIQVVEAVGWGDAALVCLAAAALEAVEDLKVQLMNADFVEIQQLFEVEEEEEEGGLNAEQITPVSDDQIHFLDEED